MFFLSLLVGAGLLFALWGLVQGVDRTVTSLTDASIFRGVSLALRAIARNPLRASLTVLGILIGVFSVVVVTAVGAGAREQVSEQIAALGSNAVIVFPMNSAASGAKGAQGSGQRLTEDDGKAILREDGAIVAAAPMLRSGIQIVAGDKNHNTQAFGTTTQFFDIRNWHVHSGDAWTEHDEAIKSKVVVIGTTVKTKLFGNENPLGRIVRIGRYPYRVLGVLESKGEGPFGDQDDTVLMPSSSMRARVMKTSPGFAGALILSAKSAEATDHAVDQVDATLRQRHHIGEDRNPDFAIRTQKEFQEMQAKIYGLFTMLLVVVAAISLIVGGIGIMNIMLVSVTERTREIGIRMAIGAREHDIRTQFLIEAVVLAVCGGLAGAGIGLGLVGLLDRLLNLPMSISPVAVGISIGTSAITGIAFGFFPARRASRLDPIVALRHE